ncbi:hypothetical protein SAMN05216226_103177 [Halovenus aranensis]|uniref:Uncharacterized protein n=1 Tax=Halovenus aranensis TaxID=890420 RepID=A0A1G8TPL2_9EURY|nr:hypothetical protein [Halovenus aranensis]SDJ43343.1 hypothetical protein SAMN05216226_103177 [Halovenus aranensis]
MSEQTEGPSECPNCGISWERHEPAEAQVKPARTAQFEMTYYTETEAGNWQCLRCGHVGPDPDSHAGDR